MPALFSWINSCLFLSSEKWNKVESLLTSWQSLQCAPCQANISQIALRKLIIATLKWSGSQGGPRLNFLWNWLSHLSHIVSVESGSNQNFLHQKRSNVFTQMTLSEKKIFWVEIFIIASTYVDNIRKQVYIFQCKLVVNIKNGLIQYIQVNLHKIVARLLVKLTICIVAISHTRRLK